MLSGPGNAEKEVQVKRTNSSTARSQQREEESCLGDCTRVHPQAGVLWRNNISFPPQRAPASTKHVRKSKTKTQQLLLQLSGV